MKTQVNKALIEKYIRGECTPEEEASVHAWLDAGDLESYPEYLSDAAGRRRELRNWKRLSRNLGGLRSPARGPRKYIRTVLPYAAAVVLLLASAWIFNKFSGGMLWWEGRQISTTFGETRKVILEDGSIVILNALSELKIPARYGEETRELFLTGEASFTVSKDTSKAFSVYAAGLTTHALGTQFNVSAYPEDEKATVSLQEGRVEVKKTGNKYCFPYDRLILNPGEEAVYKKNLILRKKSFREKERLSWTEQILYFKDASLEEVLNRLHRYYGVEFEYDELKHMDWKLNGEYKQQSLKNVLESLSFNYNIRYEIKGKKVSLYKAE